MPRYDFGGVTSRHKSKMGKYGAIGGALNFAKGFMGQREKMQDTARDMAFKKMLYGQDIKTPEGTRFSPGPLSIRPYRQSGAEMSMAGGAPYISGFGDPESVRAAREGATMRFRLGQGKGKLTEKDISDKMEAAYQAAFDKTINQGSVGNVMIPPEQRKRMARAAGHEAATDYIARLKETNPEAFYRILESRGSTQGPAIPLRPGAATYPQYNQNPYGGGIGNDNLQRELEEMQRGALGY